MIVGVNLPSGHNNGLVIMTMKENESIKCVKMAWTNMLIREINMTKGDKTINKIVVLRNDKLTKEVNLWQ
jgi:hypothetical protein